MGGGRRAGSRYVVEVFEAWENGPVVVQSTTSRITAQAVFEQYCDEFPDRDIYISLISAQGEMIDVMDSRVSSHENMPITRGGRPRDTE